MPSPLRYRSHIIHKHDVLISVSDRVIGNYISVQNVTPKTVKVLEKDDREIGAYIQIDMTSKFRNPFHLHF